MMPNDWHMVGNQKCTRNKKMERKTEGGEEVGKKQKQGIHL